MSEFNEYRELGITVTTRKVNKKKVYIISLIFIFILFTILIYVFNINKRMISLEKRNLSLNNIENADFTIVEAIEEIEETEPVEEPKNTREIRLPKLTEKAKINISNIYQSTEKIAYLTFDDGPSSNITPQILEILDRYNIKATFFLLGQNIDRYPELVNEEYDKGHYIANHGYSHVYDKIYSNEQAVLEEYNRTEESIKKALNIQDYSSHLFRYPGGSGGTKYKNVKNQAKSVLAENNIAYLDWNALTNDSVGTPTEESIISNLISTVGEKNSVVVLMHDASTKQLTVNTLPQVIDYLIEQGYSFKNFYDIME